MWSIEKNLLNLELNVLCLRVEERHVGEFAIMRRKQRETLRLDELLENSPTHRDAIACRCRSRTELNYIIADGFVDMILNATCQIHQ